MLEWMRRPGSSVSVRAMTQKVISPGRSVATPLSRVDLLAIGRQDRRHADQVLLLDIGIAQGEFERRQPLPMDADAAGEEKARRNRKHVGAAITSEIG